MSGLGVFPAKHFPRKIAAPGNKGVIGFFPLHHFLHELEHFIILRLVAVEHVPGIIVQLLQALGRYVPGLKNNPVAGVVIPVIARDASLTVHIIKCLRVRKRCQHGEFCHIKLYLKQKIDEPLDGVLGVIVKAKQYGALNGYAVVVIAPDPVPDMVGCVKDSLIDIPGPCLCRGCKNLVVLLDGMAAPLFFKPRHFPEQAQLPLLVLRKGIVHDEKPVIVDACHLLYNLIVGAGPELPAAQEIDAAGIAVETAPA